MGRDAFGWDFSVANISVQSKQVSNASGVQREERRERSLLHKHLNLHHVTLQAIAFSQFHKIRLSQTRGACLLACLLCRSSQCIPSFHYKEAYLFSLGSTVRPGKLKPEGHSWPTRGSTPTHPSAYVNHGAI